MAKTSQEKIQAILDKEKLEDLPEYLEFVKQYMLGRFAQSIQESHQENNRLEALKNKIVNGKS